MPNHYRAAAVHVERVEQIRAELAAEYSKPTQSRPLLGALHAEMGNALKLAEIHATLAVADAIEGLELAR